MTTVISRHPGSHAAGAFPGGLKGIIFDCDGVLFDSKGANTAYYNHIRSLLGLPPMNREEETQAHMLSTREVLECIVPPERLEEALAAGKAVSYSTLFMPLMRPAPMMREFLREAGERGVRLGICTNRSDSIFNVLSHFEMSGIFDPVVTVTRAKPKPDPKGLLSILETWGAVRDEVAYVGDSLVDEQASLAAGIPFISFMNETLAARLLLQNFSELFAALPKA